MYPISDLTAFCRKTTGDVPPKLVGASTTVVGSKMYLYGGRLVSERKMVSDIYMFDLETFKWERVAQSTDDDIPQARYFHSADTWRNHLIIFGGMAIKPQSDNPEDLCVLNDVRLFDLTTRHWLPATPTPADSSLVPNARYAHLSSVTADRFFIVGGQDLANVWLDDVYIFDLVAKTWIQRRDYPRHCGTYRSVAVTADQRVRLPQDELRGMQPSPRLGQPGTRFNVDKKTAAAPNATQSDALIHLPYSAAPTDEYPCDIFLFSNYNFTDVQRELEVFTPLSDGDFTVSDRSSAMTGTSFPPGLRFPTGAILGTFFIVAGTYLSQTYQSFSIWALDLINMTWSRIDPGSALASGSWFRSCLWASANKFVVFGNRHGNLVEDYNRRLLSWDHVTCIDLEAFGIYQPPPLMLDVPMQELGLAALEEGLMADFEIICDDGRRIKVSRKLLEERWPWFKEQRQTFIQAASRALEAMAPIASHTSSADVANANRQEERPDPRLTSRSFNLSEPYPIALAFMQYFYSMGLITPLQHAPAVLSQLLLLSSTYQLTHLQSLVKHAMHRALSYATSVGIYGVSTLCSCRSLQIRALRVVMAYSQKRPAGGRAKNDKDGAGGVAGRGSDASAGSGGNGRLDAPAAARPRGMSDASYMRGASDNGGSNQRGFARGASIPEPLAGLADLQEFGIPGYEMLLPSGSISSSSGAFPLGRMSDMSAALPSVDETYLHFSPATTRGASVQSSPPNVALPAPPAQQFPRRAESHDTRYSLDTFGGGEVATFSGLPLRPRRVASMDTVSSNSSSHDPRADRGVPAMKKTPSPPPIIARPTTQRPFSVMSQSTEQDIFAIAEMLSPSVDASTIEMEPIPEAPLLEECESFDDTFADDVAALSTVPESVRARDSFNSAPSVYSSRLQRESFQAMSMRSMSIYTDSDGVSYLDDEFPDPALLSAPSHHANRGFPRGPFGVPSLDDSHSLSPSTSYSSLRTPSLSRAPSLAYLTSPPVSPTSSYGPGDVAAPSSPPMPNPNGKLLGIIEESLYVEETEHLHSRHISEDAQTVNFQGYVENGGTPHAHRFPASRVESPSSSRSNSRNQMRGSVDSTYNNAMYSPIRSHPGLRSESRSDTRSPPPARGPPPARRLPPLQLPIPGASSSASAPPMEIAGMSPFGQQSPPVQQRRSAHPQSQTRLPFGREQERHQEEERHLFMREMQPSFGKYGPPFASEPLSPYTPDSADARSAEFTRPFPEMGASTSERQKQTSRQQNLHYPPQPQPPQAPVPPSPVMSATSSQDSDKRSIRSGVGIGKFFGKGSSDKSEKASSKKKSIDSSHRDSNASVGSSYPQAGGFSKADEKRLKKEAARARTERLAQDLAEKTKKRVEEAKAAKADHIKTKSKRPWEEGGGMYEGISYF